MTVENSGPHEEYVREIFDSIAPRYEFINRIISWGMIDTWRSRLLASVEVPVGGRILDLCSGTGELTCKLAANTPADRVIGVDLSPEMVRLARKDLPTSMRNRIRYHVGNALDLEFPASYFDCATVAFGLRNIPAIPRALGELERVLRPGGKLLVLDLGKPRLILFRHLYFFYFEHILPNVSWIFSGSRKPYMYLVRSLAEFPAPARLETLFLESGFQDVSHKELNLGIAAIIWGTVS